MKIRIGRMILPVLLAGVMTSAAYGGVFDVYYDYPNPDGTYSYYFEQGLKVTLDEEWYKNTMVIADDNGATFYHKASYEAYKEEGYEGGRLFTLGASVNTDFKDLPSFEYIGFDEKEAMNYYAVLPTDVQAYMKDEATAQEYEKLYAGVKDVIGEISIVPAGDDAQEESLFTRVSYEDEYSCEIPSGWGYRTQDNPDALYASATESEEGPYIIVREADDDEDAGGRDLSMQEYADKLLSEFLDGYSGHVAAEPEQISYEPEGSNRKLTGFRCAYSSDDETRRYAVMEYVEEIGDDLYRYSCVYLLSSEHEGEFEDETTYFEYLHAIDTMQVAD